MISTRGRYALRVMLDLAQQNTDSYIPLEEIAKRQGISKKYLEIIIKALVHSNMLEGLRGKGGGYRLTRTPDKYSVGEILEMTEGSLAIVSCLQPDAKPCERRDNCATYPMWARLDSIVHNFFYGITLDTLLKKETTDQ